MLVSYVCYLSVSVVNARASNLIWTNTYKKNLRTPDYAHSCQKRSAMSADRTDFGYTSLSPGMVSQSSTRVVFPGHSTNSSQDCFPYQSQYKLYTELLPLPVTVTPWPPLLCWTMYNECLFTNLKKNIIKLQKRLWILKKHNSITAFWQLTKNSKVI